MEPSNPYPYSERNAKYMDAHIEIHRQIVYVNNQFSGARDYMTIEYGVCELQYTCVIVFDNVFGEVVYSDG